MERETKLIDMDVEDGKNIIDKFLSLVYSATLVFQFDKSNIENIEFLDAYTSIEKSIFSIERKLQDFSDEEVKIKNRRKRKGQTPLPKKGNTKYVYGLLTVAAFLFSKKQFEKNVIATLSKYLAYLSNKLNSFIRSSELYHGHHLIYPHEVTWEHLFRTHNIRNFRSLFSLSEDVGQYDLLIRELTYEFEKALMQYEELDNDMPLEGTIDLVKPTYGSLFDKEYNFTLTFSTNSKNASQISYLIWVLSTGFETIDNVKVELSDWGRGSFWVKLGITIKGWVSKVEFISLLKKTAQSLHDHYFNPNKEKLEVEVELLKSEIERRPSIMQSQELHEIDIQSKKLDLEDKQLDVRLKKLTVIKEATALFKDAIIRVDSDFNAHINEILLFTRTNGEFEVGEGLDALGNDEE